MRIDLLVHAPSFSPASMAPGGVAESPSPTGEDELKEWLISGIPAWIQALVPVFAGVGSAVIWLRKRRTIKTDAKDTHEIAAKADTTLAANAIRDGDAADTRATEDLSIHAIDEIASPRIDIRATQEGSALFVLRNHASEACVVEAVTFANPDLLLGVEPDLPVPLAPSASLRVYLAGAWGFPRDEVRLRVRGVSSPVVVPLK